MQISLEQDRQVTVVRVKEPKLTYPLLASFFGEIARIVDDGARNVVVDLEAVAYLDSAAIGCLVDVHRLLEGPGGGVKLSGLQRRIATMFSMTGVHKIVDIHPTAEEARAAFEPKTVEPRGRAEGWWPLPPRLRIA